MSDVRVLVDSSSLDVAEGQTVDLKATVVDSDGVPVEGARIEWSSANTDIAEVTPDGRLTAKQAGKVELTASTFGGVWDFWAWIRSLPKSIAIAAGSGQEGIAGETLPTPLTVRVVDRKGDPSAGIPVTFSVTSGEGSVSPASGVTDAEGRVSAEWTLGEPGEQGVEARVHPEYAKVMSRSTVAFTAIAQEPDTEDPPVSPGKVTIAVPADTVLEIGATATLTAVARDADGILIEDATIQWSSSNPEIMTVDDMGRLVARAAGTVLIAAAAAGCSSDTQRMVVEPPVESESPAAVTDLEVVDVTTDAITLRWTSVSDGNGGVAKYVVRAGSPTLNWQAAGSTQRSVDADGVGEEVVYTYSGLQPGTSYEVGVDSYRGSLDAEPVYGGRPDEVASRTQEAGGTTGQLVGECSSAAAAWIWCDDFEQNRLDSYFEYDDAGGSFARVEGAGVSGSPGMRVRFSAGQVDAGSLKLAFGKTPSSYFDPVDAGVTSHRDVYWRMYVRNAPGWTGGGGEKLSRATSFAGDNWQQAMIAHVWSGGSNGNRLVIDPASGTDAAGNLQTTSYNDFANLRWLGARTGQTPLFDSGHVGSWYCIEAHVRLNGAGQSNGVFEYWIDGDLEARTTELNWVGAYDDYGINAVFVENHWNDGAPRAQERYIDNFVVSTARIGCGSGASAPPPGEVPPANAPVRIEVNPSTVTLNGAGDTYELTATAYNADGAVLSNVDLEWSSSNTGIVEVDATGRILARATGVATIIVAAVCCDVDAVSQVRVDEESPGAAEPAIVENFSTYTSTADFMADPRGIYALSSDHADTGGTIELDTSRGVSGSGRSMKYTFPVGTAEHSIGRAIDVSRVLGPQTEIWVEVVVEFDTHFTLENPRSSAGESYKFLHLNGPGSAGRFGLNFENGNDGGLNAEGPNDDYSRLYVRGDPRTTSMDAFTDGRDHTVRYHVRLGDNDFHEFWVDGAYQGSATGSTAEYAITEVALGKNINQLPPERPQSVWWKLIRIYTADPGW